MLENRDGRRGVDQPPLLLGPLATLGEPLRRCNRRQSLVDQPDWNAYGAGQPRSALACLSRRRTLPTAQAPRQPDRHLDRLILVDHRRQLCDLLVACPYGVNRVGQHALRITSRHANAHIAPVQRDPYATTEPHQRPFLRTRPQIGLDLADFGFICGLVRRNVASGGLLREEDCGWVQEDCSACPMAYSTDFRASSARAPSVPPP